MKNAKKFALAAVAILGAGAAGAIYTHWNRFVPLAAMGLNYVRYLNAPKGELTIETAPGASKTQTARVPRVLAKDDGEWPSYNKTLTSDRFSGLNEMEQELGELLAAISKS
jgi:alcohol dehydrogenase (cytochrome c)